MARSTSELPGIETPPVKAADAAPDAKRSLYPAHYAPPPAPPGSLTPMAMDEIDADADTLRRARRRFHQNPTIRTGVAIIATGALIGGMLGLAQHAQQRQGHTAAAAHAAPPAAVAETPSAEAPSKEAAPASEAAALPSAARALAAQATPPAPLVLQAPIVVSRTASPKPMVRAKVAKTHLASAAALEPKEKPAPKEPKIAAAPAKEAPKEVKKAEPPPPKVTSGAREESERILKAAQASTEDSL